MFRQKVAIFVNTGNITGIPARLASVRGRILAAAHAARRNPDKILLVAVSKTHAASAVRAAVAAGQIHFGENQLQEALPKIEATRGLGLVWHYIGPLQSNKTHGVAERFDWVHSVDRLKIAERLNLQRPAGLPPLNVCIQVNISAEASKSGIVPALAPALAHAVTALPQLRLRGLMTVPQQSDDVSEQRAAFRSLRQLHNQLCKEGIPLDSLSMGMSADLEAAVLEGATLLRVGTDIFGAR
jgi:hypothetical protein